ncbi:hypothetical protein FE257_005904 [Aspergillus nanangensis]|uniref:AMP-dependent synthetase/ligase domain-containing protein n=1 Tax=Aspergillus nanangensis TaxID=2582783 RepID=A0AAD4CPY1_ASPNN|nr:hypothetical protein FE257_005904 [Aspergillus nanangensis]
MSGRTQGERKCAHGLIHEQYLANPNAIAVSSWDGSLDYSQLEEHTNAFASRLGELGGGPEQVVALCFEKSKWTTVAILGTVEAGATFLLLDPSCQPLKRMSDMCREANSIIIVSSTTNATIAKQLPGTLVVLSSDTLASMGSKARASRAAIARVTPDKTAASRPVEVVSLCKWDWHARQNGISNQVLEFLKANSGQEASMPLIENSRLKRIRTFYDDEECLDYDWNMFRATLPEGDAQEAARVNTERSGWICRAYTDSTNTSVFADIQHLTVRRN